MSLNKPTPEDRASAFEILIDFLLKERKTIGDTVNQINQNHNTVILLLVILILFVIGGLGGLMLFTQLI